MSKHSKTRKIIIIGGSDPSGGAGIQADLSTLDQMQISTKSVITAITAQNEKKFLSYESVSVQNFSNQLQAASFQTKNPWVKIGMIGDHRLIPPLLSWIKKIKPAFVILDPVLQSSTGACLLDRQGISLLPKIFPWVDLLTPNLFEAEILSGIKIKNLKNMQRAGEKLLEKGLRNILMKGGHLRGKPCDIFMNSEMDYFFKGNRIRSKNSHGTGCTLASAILGYWSLGKNLVESIRLGKEMVRKKIQN